MLALRVNLDARGVKFLKIAQGAVTTTGFSSASREGLYGVGVKFPIFAVNCSCLPLSSGRVEEEKRKTKKEKRRKSKKKGKFLRPPSTPTGPTPLRTSQASISRVRLGVKFLSSSSVLPDKHAEDAKGPPPVRKYPKVVCRWVDMSPHPFTRGSPACNHLSDTPRFARLCLFVCTWKCPSHDFLP